MTSILPVFPDVNPDDLAEIIDRLRMAADDHERQAHLLRGYAADCEKKADARGIPYHHENVPFAAPTHTKRRIKHDIAAKLVARYLEKTGLSRAQFAVRAHLDEKTIRRLLKSHSAEHHTWDCCARAMEMKVNDLLRTPQPF